MLAQLIPVKGGPPVTLTRTVTVVGRSRRLCDLTLLHGSVSKMHCILVKTDGLIFMRDLGSTNGTRVNGQRVLRGALLPGDQISFAGTTFQVHLGPDPRLSAGGIDPGMHTEPVPIADRISEEGGSSSSDVRLLSESDFLPE